MIFSCCAQDYSSEVPPPTNKVVMSTLFSRNGAKTQTIIVGGFDEFARAMLEISIHWQRLFPSLADSL